MLSTDLRIGLLLMLRGSGEDDQWQLAIRDFVRTAYSKTLKDNHNVIYHISKLCLVKVFSIMKVSIIP